VSVLDVFVAVVLIRNAMHVLMNLLRSSVVIRPVWIRRKGIGVIVCRDVAFTPGIPFDAVSRHYSGKTDL
jgi:hypothetical protein